MSGFGRPSPGSSNTNPRTLNALLSQYHSSGDSDSGHSSGPQRRHLVLGDDDRTLQPLPIPPISPLEDVPYLPDSRSVDYGRPVFLQPVGNDNPRLPQNPGGLRTLELEQDYPERDSAYHPGNYPVYSDSTRQEVETGNIQWTDRPNRAHYRPQTLAYPSGQLLLPGSPGPSVTFYPPVLPNTYPASSSPSSTQSSSNDSRHRSEPTSPVSPSQEFQSPFPDAGPGLRRELGLGPTAEVSLNSLPDPPPGVKPPHALPLLIKLAIWGSPMKRLTLQEIYTAVENRFEWYKNDSGDKAWKSSIRHNLSLNKVFRSVPKPITEPGKGSYWHLDMSGGEGYKRPRKRKVKGSKRSRTGSTAENKEFSEGDDDNERTLGPNVDFGHQVGEGRTSPTSRRRTYQYPQPFSPPARHPRELLSVVTDTGHARSSGPSGSSSGSMSPASASSTTHSTTATYGLPMGSESAMVGTQPRFGETSFGRPSFGLGQTYYQQSAFGQPTFGRPAFDQGGRPTETLTTATNPPMPFTFTGEFVPMGAPARTSAYEGNTQGSTISEGRSPSTRQAGDHDATRISANAPSWGVGTPPMPGHIAEETGAAERQPEHPYDRPSGSSRRRDDRRGRGGVHK